LQKQLTKKGVNTMKTFSKVNKSSAVLIAALACIMLAGSVSTFAIPASQVARVLNIQTITAQCCVAFGPTVRLTEPVAVAPVIVTWSTDYAPGGTVQFALSVNGGPCLFYGSSVGPQVALGTGSVSIFLSASFQWIVLPSDGLVKGTNTFTVCGGGVGKPVTLNVGSNTLTVQISK
jgi:hypothetical protein